MSEHPKCWASDNSLLPSQLQFRQDSAMFPVMAMPGYFLLVLMRPCIPKEIMLIRDAKTHTSLSLWYCFGWSMESFFGLCPNEIVLISSCLQLFRAQLPHGAKAPKRLVCPCSAKGTLQGNGAKETCWMRGLCCLANAQGRLFPVCVVGNWRGT